MPSRDPYSMSYASSYGRPRRGRRWLMPAILVFFAIAAVLITVLVPDESATPPPAPAATRSAPSQTAAPTPQASDGSALQPQTNLTGLTWQEAGGLQLPISATAGPREQAGGRASGFARTPAGALVAAVHIGVRTASAWGPEVFEPTITSQVIGPDAALMLQTISDAYEAQRKRLKLKAGEPLGPGKASYEAFRWQSYTPDLAVLEVVAAGGAPDGGVVRVATRLHLAWEREDWRLVAPLGGDWQAATVRLSSLDGYTLFPGRG